MFNTTAVDAEGKKYNRLLLVILVLVGNFITFLNTTILATAFPTLMHSFHVTAPTVQWLSTGFMMIVGILTPVSAWLGSNFNSKWLYIGSMTIFEIGTIICFMAPTFAILLTGRLIQAVGAGVTIPLLQTMLLTIFPPEERGAAMGLAGLVIGMAPAIGPTLSGWVIDNWSWRVLFGIFIPALAVIIILSFFFVKPVLKIKKSHLDYISLLLSCFGLGSLLYGFSLVGNDGWGSPIVITSIIVGLLIIGLFIWRQLTMEHPFLNLVVLKSKEFALSTIITPIMFMGMIGVEMILPLYLQTVHGMNAFQSGLTLLPGALLTGIMSPITGRVFDHFGAKRLATGGLFLFTGATLPFLFLTNSTPILIVILLYMVRMLGFSMAMMPTTTSGMNALPINLIGDGTAVNNTMRQVAGSLATALMISILSDVSKNQMPSRSLIKLNPIHFKNLAESAGIDGFKAAFALAIIIGAVAWILTFFLNDKNVIGDSRIPKGGK